MTTTSKALREAANKIYNGSEYFYLAMPTTAARRIARRYLASFVLFEAREAKVLFLLLLADKLDRR